MKNPPPVEICNMKQDTLQQTSLPLQTELYLLLQTRNGHRMQGTCEWNRTGYFCLDIEYTL